MLISHRHRFLFVHIYKTAGISISSALIPYAATPRQLRVDSAFNRLGLSFLYPRVIRGDSTVRDWISNGMNNVFERMRFLDEHPQPVHEPHVTASEIAEAVGEESSLVLLVRDRAQPLGLAGLAVQVRARDGHDLPKLAAYARGLAPERRMYSRFAFLRRLHSLALHRGRRSPDRFRLFSERRAARRLRRQVRDARVGLSEICQQIGIEPSLPHLNEPSSLPARIRSTTRPRPSSWSDGPSPRHRALRLRVRLGGLVRNGPRRRGAAGRREARTQGAPILHVLGRLRTPHRDDPALPGGTAPVSPSPPTSAAQPAAAKCACTRVAESALP